MVSPTEERGSQETDFRESTHEFDTETVWRNATLEQHSDQNIKYDAMIKALALPQQVRLQNIKLHLFFLFAQRGAQDVVSKRRTCSILQLRVSYAKMVGAFASPL